MVNREANIDLLFRNGLSDYEALPPSDIWEGIKPVVAKQKRSFLFFRIAASFAVIVVSGLITAMLVRNIPSGSEKITLPLSNVRSPGILLKENILKPEQVLAYQQVKNSGETPEAITDVKPPVTETTLFSLPSPELFTSFVKNPQAGEMNRKSRSGSIQKAYIPSYPDIISEADVQVLDPLPVKDNRWSIGAMVTPAYYSSIDLSASDASSEVLNSEEPAFSYAGGLTFAYKLNSRFSVQTGINYSSIGRQIEGVNSYSGYGKFLSSKGESQFGIRTSSGTITSNNNDIYLADNNSGAKVMSVFTRDAFDPVKNNLSYISNSLSQNLNYVEVPVVIKYVLIDRNIDLKVIGGVSYNILVSNTAYSTSGGTKYYVGTTEGLSPVTLSSSLGMGMEYNFSARLSLNLEPTLRYYITPLGGMAGSSIHPYSIGIFSGISYKF
jgi:hypothetical protein